MCSEGTPTEEAQVRDTTRFWGQHRALHSGGLKVGWGGTLQNTCLLSGSVALFFEKTAPRILNSTWPLGSQLKAKAHSDAGSTDLPAL